MKNGKYFLLPKKDDHDFKELFKKLTSSGAGRPVDNDGFPQGAWTADLLADAITQIDANGSGVDLRTVQLWFQNNERGISPDNIRWLARIFGCDDPDATSDWQRELSAAHSRLMAKRRDRKKTARANLTASQRATPEITDDKVASQTHQRLSLARTSEALFSRRSSLDLPILVFAGAVTLGFLSYLLGVHHVTYRPEVGLEKQVGFVWSPGWVIEGLVLLPLFLIVVTQLLKFWKDERASAMRLEGTKALDHKDWMQKVRSFSIAFWVIFLACVFIICILQWITAYLVPLMRSATENALVDWMLIATVHPEIISVPQALLLSFLAFLYSGMIYWFYLVGLLLLFMMASDFYDVFQGSKLRTRPTFAVHALEVSAVMMRGIFRCTVLGILIATCIKLNTAYLLSDGTNILSWLVNDALAVIGKNDVVAGWLDASALPYFTSLLLVLLTCFIFFASLTQFYWVLDIASESDTSVPSKNGRQVASQIECNRHAWMKMVIVVAFLVISFVLIGQFSGFSILLASSVLLATYSLFQ